MLPRTLTCLVPVAGNPKIFPTRFRHKIGCIMVLVFFSPLTWAMSIDDYIGQVMSNNGDATGATKQVTAAKYKSSESRLLTMPNMFFEYGNNNDGKPATPPLFTYDRMENESIKFGISQNFEFGL